MDIRSERVAFFTDNRVTKTVSMFDWKRTPSSLIVDVE